MGGIDKGLHPFAGKPMIAHVLQRFAPQVGAIAINANRNLPSYGQFGVPVWADEPPEGVADFAGPLAGLHTGLVHCKGHAVDYLATAPCDSPFLPPELVVALYDALQAAGAELAVAVTGDARHLHTQPVFSLLKTALLPQLTQFLQQGGRKVDAWHATLKTVAVHFPDETAFRNINTPEDLRRCEDGS